PSSAVHPVQPGAVGGLRRVRATAEERRDRPCGRQGSPTNEECGTRRRRLARAHRLHARQWEVDAVRPHEPGEGGAEDRRRRQLPASRKFFLRISLGDAEARCGCMWQAMLAVDLQAAYRRVPRDALTEGTTNAEGRTRTCTGVAPQGILSPLRLPVSPPRPR